MIYYYDGGGFKKPVLGRVHRHVPGRHVLEQMAGHVPRHVLKYVPNGHMPE